MTEPHTETLDAPDRALRLRFDLDVRTEDEVGAGVARTGLPTPPARDADLAIVLGTALARAALAWLPGGFRRDAAIALASLTPEQVARDLRRRMVVGARIVDLRLEEQVGARGWCARAVLAEGTQASDALVAVDLIHMQADPAAATQWAARVPGLVPFLVALVVHDSPDALARSVIALNALGEEIAADPTAALDPDSAARAAAAALVLPLPVPGSRAFGAAPPDPVVTIASMPESAASESMMRPVTVPVVPPGKDSVRRLQGLAVACLAVAVATLVMLVVVISSPGTFGLASLDDVGSRVAGIEADLSQMRSDVGTLAQVVQALGSGSGVDALQQLTDRVDEIDRQVQGLCGVLPIVC